MDIEEKCKNCDNYNACFDGDDYSTDCDGGFEPREDLVELHRKLRKAVEAIKKHRMANKSWTTIEHDTELYKVLEELQ